MKIDNYLRAEILRLYHAEHWPIGTIASQLLMLIRKRGKMLIEQKRGRSIEQELEIKRKGPSHGHGISM